MRGGRGTTLWLKVARDADLGGSSQEIAGAVLTGGERTGRDPQRHQHHGGR